MRSLSKFRPSLQNNSPHRYIFSFLIGLLFICALCLLFPIAGDDWYYELYAPTTASGYIAKIISIYKNMSGRLLAHVLSVLMGTHRIIRSLFRAIVIWCISIAAYHFFRLRSIWSYFIVLTAFTILPASLFSQSYSWSVGFCNYVPQMLLMLLYFLLCSDLIHNAPSNHTCCRSIAAFFCCLAAQLFAEHTTIGLLFISAALSLWGWKFNHRIHSVSFSGFLGAGTGAFIMFVSYIFHQSDSDYYRFSFADLSKNIFENYTVIVNNTFACNYVLMFALTAACIYFLYRYNFGHKSASALSALGAICFCYYIFIRLVLKDNLNIDHSIPIKLFDMFVSFCWILFVTITLLRFTPDSLRPELLLLWCSAIICTAPLFIVRPIGPRCLYAAYFLLVLLTLQMLFHIASVHSAQFQFLRPCLLGVCGLAFSIYLFVFTRIYQGEQLQYRLIDAALAAGETEISLPVIPYAQYVHGINSDFYFSMVFNHGNADEMTYHFYIP